MKWIALALLSLAAGAISGALALAAALIAAEYRRHTERSL